MTPAFDFDAAVTAPFRMQPGLHRSGAATPALTPVAPGSRHQREKLAVLSAFAPRAFVAIEGFDPQPSLHVLCAVAARSWPDHFAWDGQVATACRHGVSVRGAEVRADRPGDYGLGDELPRCLSQLPDRWRLTGLLSLVFAEDLALVDAHAGTVPWIAACLPSRWAPEDKVGKPFAAIHAPVPESSTLLKSGDALLQHASHDHLDGGMRRHVWTVTSHARLNAHPAVLDPLGWRGDEFDNPQAPRAWWRTECQTFVPTVRGQSIFTIGIDIAPLGPAIDRARAQTLHASVASMSPAVLDYREFTPVRDALLRWLAWRAGA